MGKKKGQDVIPSDAVYTTHYQPHLFPRGASNGSQTAFIQRMIERKLFELSMNRFKWDGLPEEINIRWMEMALNYQALSVFFYDPEYDKYFAMRGAPAGQMNMVGDYAEYIVYGNQFYTKTLSYKDCVPIWANYMRMPDWDIIQIYSKRLAEIDRTIEINTKQARIAKVLSASENARLTVDTVNQDYEDGAAVLRVSQGSLDIHEAIQALDLGVNPESIISLHMLRNRQWNEVMTLLGINNANQDKKERLVAAEASGNDDMVAAIRATNLQARQQACDIINERYFLDVKVEYVTDMVTAELKNTNEETGGGTKLESGSEKEDAK